MVDHSVHELHDALYSSDLTSTLQFSQQAPTILGRHLNPVTNLLNVSASHPDDPEHYKIMERLYLTCLQTGDDKSAKLLLDQLNKRFGPLNERIMGLRGLYDEATAGNTSLEKCLHGYERILSENPVNVVCVRCWRWRINRTYKIETDLAFILNSPF